MLGNIIDRFRNRNLDRLGQPQIKGFHVAYRISKRCLEDKIQGPKLLNFSENPDPSQNRCL